MRKQTKAQRVAEFERDLSLAESTARSARAEPAQYRREEERQRLTVVTEQREKNREAERQIRRPAPNRFGRDGIRH